MSDFLTKTIKTLPAPVRISELRRFKALIYKRSVLPCVVGHLVALVGALPTERKLNMKRYRLALLALTTTLAISPMAFADDDFSFTYASLDGTATATGTLAGTEIGTTGSYQITSGTISTETPFGDYTGVIDSNPADMSAQQAETMCFTSAPRDRIRLPRQSWVDFLYELWVLQRNLGSE